MQNELAFLESNYSGDCERNGNCIHSGEGRKEGGDSGMKCYQGGCSYRSRTIPAHDCMKKRCRDDKVRTCLLVNIALG